MKTSAIKNPLFRVGWSSLSAVPSDQRHSYRVRRICQHHSLNDSARSFDIETIVYPNQVTESKQHTRFRIVVAPPHARVFKATPPPPGQNGNSRFQPDPLR